MWHPFTNMKFYTITYTTWDNKYRRTIEIQAKRQKDAVYKLTRICCVHPSAIKVMSVEVYPLPVDHRIHFGVKGDWLFTTFNTPIAASLRKCRRYLKRVGHPRSELVNLKLIKS